MARNEWFLSWCVFILEPFFRHYCCLFGSVVKIDYQNGKLKWNYADCRLINQLIAGVEMRIHLSFICLSLVPGRMTIPREFITRKTFTKNIYKQFAILCTMSFWKPELSTSINLYTQTKSNWISFTHSSSAKSLRVIWMFQWIISFHRDDNHDIARVLRTQ